MCSTIKLLKLTKCNVTLNHLEIGSEKGVENVGGS